MTRPEIAVNMPHLVSSLQLGLAGNKEEPSNGSYRVQTLPTSLACWLPLASASYTWVLGFVG